MQDKTTSSSRILARLDNNSQNLNIETLKEFVKFLLLIRLIPGVSAQDSEDSSDWVVPVILGLTCCMVLYSCFCGIWLETRQVGWQQEKERQQQDEINSLKSRVKSLEKDVEMQQQGSEESSQLVENQEVPGM